MRAIRSGFGFGCRRGGGRIGQVILVGKHGCWPPEITSLTVAVTRPRVPSNRFLADSLSGFSARRLTAKRLLGTQMLRASKTLQPQKDTRRANLVSINLRFSAVLERAFNFASLSAISVCAPSWLPCPFANPVRGF